MSASRTYRYGDHAHGKADVLCSVPSTLYVLPPSIAMQHFKLNWSVLGRRKSIKVVQRVSARREKINQSVPRVSSRQEKVYENVPRVSAGQEKMYQNVPRVSAGQEKNYQNVPCVLCFLS